MCCQLSVSPPSSDRCATPPPLASLWLVLLASLACIRKYICVKSVPSKFYRPVWFIYVSPNQTAPWLLAYRTYPLHSRSRV